MARVPPGYGNPDAVWLQVPVTDALRHHDAKREEAKAKFNVNYYSKKPDGLDYLVKYYELHHPEQIGLINKYIAELVTKELMKDSIL